MKIRLTEEQQAAVDAPLCDNLVSAAAGSGKTKVLSERIVKRLKSGDTSIDRLLIVTFTRAAATQMREKIREALEEEDRRRPSIRLRKQLALLAGADICTIDSFCIDLVRRNFFRVNVPPDFKVAEESEMIILREEAVVEVLEEMYEEGDADFLNLSRSVGKGKNDNNLKEMILKIHSFTRAFEDPDKWLDDATETHHEGSEKNNALFEDIKKEITEQLAEMGKMLYEAKFFAEDMGVDAYAGVFTGECESYNRAFKEAESLEEGFEIFSFGSFAGKKVPKELEFEKEFLRQMHEDAKDFYSKIKDLFLIYKSKAGISYGKICALVKCVKKFSEKYMEEKLSRKELEFADCEYLALKVLESDIEIVNELRKKYHEIYIDEYQDTNPLQDKLFGMISRREAGEPNLFIVGDIKQSIYRFRHSDPSLFGRKSKTFGKDEKSRKMILSKNFRSRREVLDSVNCIFEKIMRENTAQVEYNEEHRLKYGGSYIEYNKNKSELYVLGGNYEEEDELVKDQREALVVAQKIKEMKDEGFLVSGKDGMRPMEFSDVAVLSSTINSKADMIVNIFNMMDVPVYCEATKSFFDTLEIRTLISLLKSVDNPLCDIPLAAVMRSPIFSFDENELVKIREQGRDEPFYMNVSKEADNESELGLKCHSFLETMNNWREMSRIISVERFVSRVVDESGYYSFVGALPGGSVRQENIREFIALSARYEQSQFKGLYNFVRYIDKAAAGDSDIETSGGEAKNSVRVMTIHKSKGLEFPIVFVIGCGNKFNDKDATANLILNPYMGIGLLEKDADRRIKYKTAEYRAIGMGIKKENHAEQQRLLYVAMTRAKEKLIMVGTEKSLSTKLSSWTSNRFDRRLSDYSIRSMNTYLDYIASSYDEKYWDFHVVEELPALVDKSEALTCEEKEYKTVEEAIYRLSYSYPYDGIKNIPSKMSVSEIKKMSMDEESASLFDFTDERRIPSFMKEDTRLVGASRGTAYHRVMELLDFNEKNPREAIDGFVKEGLLEKNQADCIEIAKIEKFLSSDMGSLLRNAKRILREEPFTMTVNAKDVFPEGENEKIMVQGTVDCLAETGNGDLILIDYKTDFYTNPQDIGARYKTQLDLYETAVFEAFGRKCAKKYLYLLHKGDIIEV